MLFANIQFAGHDWLVPAVALFVAGFVGSLWGYFSSTATPGVRAVGITLRALGFAALAFCLLEPLWGGSRPKPGSNFFVILADNSQGMQIRDRGEPQTATRGEELRKLITNSEADWQLELEQNFEVRRYQFDSRLQLTKDFSELKFDGRSTSLASALRTLTDRYKGRPLAGVLLLTDGNATDMAGGVSSTEGLPPVYPIVFGKDLPNQDVSIKKIAVTQTAFEDAPVTIQADVVASGYSGATLVGQLFDADGKSVEEQTGSIRGDDGSVSFRYRFRPEKPGVSFYRLRVGAKDEMGQFEKPDSTKEATLANNQRVIMVDRGQGPYRILYVAGRPDWEFKFLNRAVDEDHQIELVALIRVALREPKFEFRGGKDSISNPLFKGFGNEGEDAASYADPVLKAMNVGDATELVESGRTQFPTTAESLYRYSAIILDKIEAAFFTRDQQVLLQKFVSERGGAVIMLGAAESFTEGKYDNTPVGDMLPVYLDRAQAQLTPGDFHFELDREGWVQPWVRLRSTEVEETARLETMTGMQVLNQIRQPKPGASLFGSVVDKSGKRFPALVVQRFGRGQTGALMVGDLWRWGFQSEENMRDLGKAWRQTIRWLTSDVPERLELAAVESHDANQSLQLDVRVKDKKFLPLDNANVVIHVHPETVKLVPGSAAVSGSATNAMDPKTDVQLPGEPGDREAGLYQNSYIPREIGAYRAEATVTDASGLLIGKVQTGWTSDPAAEEFASLKPNRQLMAKLAQQTGGEVVDPTKLAAFVEKLPNLKAPIMETWTVPLWDTKTVFFFALACFITEWGLRRLKGLA